MTDLTNFYFTSASEDKTKVVTELHKLMDERLFGNQPWLADSETALAIDHKLSQLGLREEDGMSTPLGDELDLELVIVFVGTYFELDVPEVLLDFGLLERSEAEDLYAGPDLIEHGETVLRPLVQQAYFKHYYGDGRPLA